MTLYEQTQSVIEFIERVAANPSTSCNKCAKWYRDGTGKEKGVCKAYKALTFKTDFCLKEFEKGE